MIFFDWVCLNKNYYKLEKQLWKAEKEDVIMKMLSQLGLKERNDIKGSTNLVTQKINLKIFKFAIKVERCYTYRVRLIVRK